MHSGKKREKTHMSFKRLLLTSLLACFGLLVLALLLSPSASADIGIDEIYDEGAKGTDQFVEVFNPSDTPEDLSEYYLSLLQNPKGAGYEYGDYDLTSYDDDGWLEEDEFIVVTDEEVNLGSYTRMGIYLKSDNSLVSEVAWSFAGMALDPVTGMSAQLPYDNSKKEYVFDKWTLAYPTKEARNIVAVPDFEAYKVVINEVNADYVELYNAGSSTVTLDGYKVAGYRNAYTIPPDTEIEPGGYYLIPKTKLLIADNGGDMKLLNKQGVLCDVMTWDPQGRSRAASSYAARHIDGLGARGVYLEEDANQDYPWLPNLWWEFEVDDTEGGRNYPGTTIIIDGLPEVFDLCNVTDGEYEKGIHQGSVESMISPKSWDVILYNGTVESAQADVLTAHLNSGGRLYLEERDFIELKQDHVELYDMLHVKVMTYSAGAIGNNVLAGDLYAEGMTLKYNPTAPVNERLDPLYDAFRIMYMKSSPLNRFAAGYIENATTGYRVVSSALQYRNLRADANEPREFVDALLQWFSEPDLNHAPNITLLEGQAGSTTLVDDKERITSLGWLGWSNDDPDYWDQDIWRAEDENGHEQYKFMEFTVYLDSEQSKVENHDGSCLVIGTVNTTFFKPRDLEPTQYFWTVRAEDRFGKTEGAGAPPLFSFYYDNVTPEMLSIKPYFKNVRGVANTGEDMMGFYVANGYHPTFGPEGEGVPEGILFKAYDEHLGISFTELEKTELRLRYVSPTPDIPGGVWPPPEVGILAKDGTSIDPYNCKNTVEFTADLPDEVFEEDGALYPGRYTIEYRLVDFVGNYFEDVIIFTVDKDAPDTVTDIYVSELDHPIYVNTGIQYLKAGENYQLNGTGPTTRADGTLDRIEFVMIDKLFNPTEQTLANYSLGEIAAGTDTKNYLFEFEAQADYEYFYAACYDRAGNYAQSEILTKIVVDAYAPTQPYAIDVEPSGMEYVEVSGWARDSLVSGKTSGMAYVLIYVNGEAVTHDRDGVYEWMGNVPYEAGEEMKFQVVANHFTVQIPLSPVSNIKGDVRNVIQVRGVDNVGNVGNLSDENAVPPIRMLDPQKSLNVAILEPSTNVSDDVEQLRNMSITMLQFAPGDFQYHFIEMRYHPGQPDVDPSALAMQGYWTVESDLTGDFRARVTIFFNHLPISLFDFGRLRLVTRSEGETQWTVIEDAVFVHQEANPAQGIPELWYVEAVVDSFSDFAIAQGRPDLQITDTHIFANPLMGGQSVRISATVRNVGALAPPVENVAIRVYYTDEQGAESTIGWIEFQDPIEPGKDNEQSGEVIWGTPSVMSENKMTFYVKFKVDPNAEVAEYHENNNDAYIDENNDKKIDPIEVLRPSAPVVPHITSPANSTVVSGVVTFTGELPEPVFGTTTQPHTQGFQMNIIDVAEEYPLISLIYQLRDAGGMVVPGELGHVIDIYGLKIADAGVTIAFDDADRDGQLSAGDTFFMKDLDHGGPAAHGFTLKILPNEYLDYTLSIKELGNASAVGPGDPITTLGGNDPWSYRWDSTTVEDGDYAITVYASDDGSSAHGIVVTVDNVKDEEDDKSFLARKLGPLPAYLYLIITAVLLVAGVLAMKGSFSKIGKTGQQPQQQEPMPLQPQVPKGSFQGQYYIPPSESPQPQQPPPLHPSQFQQPPLVKQPHQPPETWHCFRCGNDVEKEKTSCTRCGNDRPG